VLLYNIIACNRRPVDKIGQFDYFPPQHAVAQTNTKILQLHSVIVYQLALLYHISSLNYSDTPILIILTP